MTAARIHSPGPSLFAAARRGGIRVEAARAVAALALIASPLSSQSRQFDLQTAGIHDIQAAVAAGR